MTAATSGMRARARHVWVCRVTGGHGGDHEAEAVFTVLRRSCPAHACATLRAHCWRRRGADPWGPGRPCPGLLFGSPGGDVGQRLGHSRPVHAFRTPAHPYAPAAAQPRGTSTPAQGACCSQRPVVRQRGCNVWCCPRRCPRDALQAAPDEADKLCHEGNLVLGRGLCARRRARHGTAGQHHHSGMHEPWRLARCCTPSPYMSHRCVTSTRLTPIHQTAALIMGLGCSRRRSRASGITAAAVVAGGRGWLPHMHWVSHFLPCALHLQRSGVVR